MKQTAMQQAIKEIAELWSSPTYTQIFNVLENKLEMEKQQIIDAYIEGYSADDHNVDSEQYYNKTFNE